MNRLWDRPDTQTNQVLAIGESIMGNNEEFGVEGSNFIIFTFGEKHSGEYRCKVRDGQVTHTVKLSQDDFPHSSEKIISNKSSIPSFHLSLILSSLTVYLLLL